MEGVELVKWLEESLWKARDRGRAGGREGRFYLPVVLPTGHADCCDQDLLRACVNPCVYVLDAGCETRGGGGTRTRSVSGLVGRGGIGFYDHFLAPRSPVHHTTEPPNPALTHLCLSLCPL